MQTGMEDFPRSRFLVIEIEDDGPGMPDQVAEACVAPLAASAGGKGKGFGLFITREILQHHGGSVEIKTGNDRGTLVRLCLPASSGGGR